MGGHKEYDLDKVTTTSFGATNTLNETIAYNTKNANISDKVDNTKQPPKPPRKDCKEFCNPFYECIDISNGDYYCKVRPCGWALNIALGIAILMVCIMVPLSFHYIQYNEYAFVRNKFGKTDTGEVITQGRYFYPLTHDVIRFPATYTEVRFVGDNAQSIFTKEGYQILLSISFWFKIPPESLAHIYNKYSLNYKNSIINEAKLIIKNLAGTANTGLNVELEKYITDRRNISQTIADYLSRELYNEFGIDVPTEYVKLMFIGIPNTLVSQYSRTVEQIQKNQLEQNKQALEQIKAETQTIVTNTKVQTEFILSSAKIDADRIVMNSKSLANNIITSSRGKGLKIMMDKLNITSQDDINRFIRIMSLGENTNKRVFYNMDNQVIVN
jgi:hypothetical protein